MPKRQDIESILILGAGPIVIGQACEFDYSGAQACKALKEDGYKVILVNSNPATIMTDPSLADATYIEPIHWKTIETIIAKEKPDVILPTMGGQTALNTALDLNREGVLEAYDVQMIGATKEAIDKAEDRDLFSETMRKIGLKTPKAALAHDLKEANKILEDIGFPCVLRPNFTMGGAGGGVAYNYEEFEEICLRGFDLSPTSEIYIDQYLEGWKEYEMEVVRDKNDNCIIVCSIENLDPMGVHTGDSITVAPAQTLTDKEFQSMRNASMQILREVGVETGGSNVQFTINPVDGEMLVIEMNPRVSRSSALASKATGFPIAKVAAKLAVGYTLDELTNDITGGIIPSSFEPSIDYVVTKIPRFNFEKFPQAEPVLTTQMKSVGEVMAIGRTFQESFQKAIRGLEIGKDGLDEIYDSSKEDISFLKKKMSTPSPDRIWYVADSLRFGLDAQEVFNLTKIDPWFIAQIEDLIKEEDSLNGLDIKSLSKEKLYALKQKGFSDRRLSFLLNTSELSIRKKRKELGVKPVFKRVDTCAAEFSSSTAYMYSTYEEECESNPTDNKKVIVLGGGPNRIGQGIEFDYCCVHASLAIKEIGFESIMVNCNPETVSTDYDVSDRLYFEPITLEDVLAIIDLEDPEGVIIQYGGQTPLKLAKDLEENGVKIWGTSPDSIDLAEDRGRFQEFVHKLELLQPPNGLATNLKEALEVSKRIGFPLVVRPSYVLGGRAMEIVYNHIDLENYLVDAVEASEESPVLLDSFLNQAVELDIEAVCDGKAVIIGGILQHIEQAGIHSGDSACSLPPYNMDERLIEDIHRIVKSIALEINAIGLINVQLAYYEDTLYLLEVNPRASRTIPFVSKCIGRSLAQIGTKCMAGISLSEQGFHKEIIPNYFSVKEAVLPFAKFQGVDPILGPEMKSTGEVMGIGKSFAEAYAKAQLGAGENIPAEGCVFLSVRNSDQEYVADLAKEFHDLGFKLVATKGTAKFILDMNLPVAVVKKVAEGRPHVVDMMKNGEIQLIVNTTEGRQSILDSASIRRTALEEKIYCTTTIEGGRAVCAVLRNKQPWEVERLQDLHKNLSI
ncbi:MAG: carbamoyl-phosphate synthase large subunit [Gammaproteobacteria bacterium]|nr:MAG: carbamoyl-phosphate synthase large subunit [Gammaproteobacteria bacterium]